MALIVAVLMVAVLLAVLVYMMGIVVFYTFLLVVPFAHLRRTYRLDDWEPYEELLDVSYAKPVSILVPAYNEEAGIVGSVRSLLSIEYPEYEVIVINDGSTDRTLERLVEHFGLRPVYRVVRRQLATKEIKTIYRSSAYPHLFVLDKENGGKADALNAGINVARYPYICSIDGDSVLERRRWHRGLLESLWRHRALLGNPKYGSIGLLSLPYFWVIEFLGPVMELAGYIVMAVSLFLGSLYMELALLLLAVSVLYGSLLSAAAVLLEEWTERKFPNVSDFVWLFFFSLTETFWYRPLTAWWRCEGIIDAIRRQKQWGSMKRKGVSA
ncbi:Poly-beta-1,6-N-acetyl-D-glucosamine synthase [[Flavobacterium] thermophilum]|nr:Poly-beta-1,6-N-acetyl-D-glucosamine synthase [Geobacillus sp. 12AMOR1]STO11556.1 Poly-beta-1,6-N-acetyl-D-glucosamine synthase [[Flavobacterium] thermophilum]